MATTTAPLGVERKRGKEGPSRLSLHIEPREKKGSPFAVFAQ